MKIKVNCTLCGSEHLIEVKEKDWQEWENGTDRKVQEVFPYLSPADRELFITGFCDSCFQKVCFCEDWYAFFSWCIKFCL